MRTGRIAAFIVLLTGLSLTGLCWKFTDTIMRDQSQNIFHNEVDRAVIKFKSRVETWINLMNGVRGLFVASQSVERQEFASYIEGINPAMHYPEFKEVAYFRYLTDDAVSLAYLEPSTAEDDHLLGYNIASSEALRVVKDSGFYVGSGSFLRHPSDDDVLIYSAIYKNAGSQEAIGGFIVGVFDGASVLHDILDPKYESSIGFDFGGGPLKQVPLLEERRRVDIGNHSWPFRFYARPEFFTVGQRWLPSLVILVGSVISVLLFGIIWMLATSRERTVALAENLTRDFYEGEERFKTLIDNIPGVIYRCANDPSWTIEFISDYIKEITGYPASDFIDNRVRSYASIIHPSDAKLVDSLVQEGVREKRPFIIEYRLFDSTGSIKWVHEKGRGIFDEHGKLLHLDGAIFDVTARKNLEDQLHQAQKMESVGQLAGGVAHDFNNIMMIINFHTERLAEILAENSACRKSLDVLLRSSKRATSLTQQLLAFGRRQILDLTLLELNSFIKENLDNLTALAGPEIKIIVNLSAEPLPIRGDHNMMSSVLVNLVGNARDAMTQGGTITIETGIADHPEKDRGIVAVPAGRYASLCVKDTGPGISSEEVPHIFEPFYTTKPIGKGTGLGLAMVYGIVHQHEGHIVFKSEGGAQFQMYFPMFQEGASLTLADRKISRVGATILVVEDEAELLAIAEEILTDAGYRVLTAQNGRRALEIADGPIDLLFTDIIMPLVTGTELARQLLQSHPSMKVLYTSGYADDIIVRHGISRTSGVFVPKPYNADELLRKVRELLGA